MVDSNLPAWTRAIVTLGVPAAIALFLVYSLAQFATVGITEMNRQMEAHAQVLLLHDAGTLRSSDAMVRLLLRVCLNTARTNDDRQRCVADR